MKNVQTQRGARVGDVAQACFLYTPLDVVLRQYYEIDQLSVQGIPVNKTMCEINSFSRSVLISV